MFFQTRAPQLTYENLPKPPFLGVKEITFTLEELLPYIDWTPFFSTWELKGRYPDILEHPQKGPAAKELFEQAQALLPQLENWLTFKGRYGFFNAARQGDDIHIQHQEKDYTLPTLRQQVDKGDKPYWALADLIAPANDTLGAFVVTTGLGIEGPLAEFKKELDDYSAILLKSLADRLAEAAAECLHARVRKAWYAPEEELSSEALIAESYRGIRPAPGYPACPEHSQKELLFALLGAEELGVSLTEHYAMHPAASVSGWYFAHPESRYFSISALTEEQVQDYAQRKAISQEKARQLLAPYLLKS